MSFYKTGILLFLLGLVLFLNGTQASPNAAASLAVSLKPSDNIQFIVGSYPPGTIFHIAPGTYRLQQIKPKDGDSFIGSGAGTILTGAVTISSFRKLGNLFSGAYEPIKGQVHGYCDSRSPMCKYPEDCFFDNRPLHRVATVAELVSGAWLLDDAGRSVMLADDPTGHSIEISTARSAFSGNASDVTISDLTIEKYAIPAQMGAIGDQFPGPRWVISRCIVRFNHGTGISVSDHSIVRDNQILSNGQQGVTGRGDGIIISKNEIAFNNFAGFALGWEAGASKFSNTNHLVVTQNVVHDNIGAGLWTDIGNRQTSYQSNVVYNNGGPGITHEISFAAKITGNFVFGNGRIQSIWLWGAQISVQNSSDVEVSKNKVFVPKGFGNGIVVIMQNRGDYVAANNTLHDNEITYLDPWHGASGIACDYPQLEFLVPTNQFDRNHYHVLQGGGRHWAWLREKTWEDFQKTGNEIHGTLDNEVYEPSSQLHLGSL